MSRDTAINAMATQGPTTLKHEKEPVGGMAGTQKQGLMGRLRAARLGLVAAVAVVFAAGAVPAAAQADLLSTFEASSSSTQAGAHADARTNFVVTDLINNPVKTMRFKLPVGLMGSIGDFAECPLSTFFSTGSFCPPESQVGEGMAGMNAGSPAFPWILQVSVKAYVLKVGRGDTALIGVHPGFLSARPLIRINVRPDDYGLDATVDGLPNVVASTDLTLWGVPWDHWDPTTQSQNKRLPFMVNPARCGTADVTTLEVDGYKNPGVWEEHSATTPAQTGCDQLRFDPEISVKADSPFVSGPSGFDFGIDVPQSSDPNGLGTPPLRNVTAVLPEGVTINPSLANGLDACSDAAFGKGSSEQSTCPASSKIGTAEFEVPALKDPHVAGSVYTGEPLPGNRYRLFVEAYGSSVRVKLKGTVRPDPVTGQLTATFENNPQAPASSIRLAFKGGPRAALVMPDTCGKKTVSATLESWPGQKVDLSTVFDVAFDAGGAACQAKGFAPSFGGGAANPVAGDRSPFSLTVARADRDQELKAVKSVVLPKGLLAEIGSVPLCGEAQAAAGSCPEASRVGRVEVTAGAGSSPLPVPQAGKAPTGVYLTGSYKGAQYGLSIKVPAQAGPYDLGTVVVRSALRVDQKDAHVTAETDDLPQILEGIPLRVRSVAVVMDRPGFMFNPTNCTPQNITAQLTSTGGTAVDRGARFQVGECGELEFDPALAMRLGTAKGSFVAAKTPAELVDGGHPALSARVAMNAGRANNAKATVTLPLSLALDPDNANGLCEPVDAARNSCPAASIVGSVKAVTPLLSGTVDGPVYFVRGERIDPKSGRTIRTLPKLFVPLTSSENPLVKIDLHASSEVKDDRLVTTFDNLPDVPISTFDLNINGGKNGILVVSNTNACATAQYTDNVFTGQSGKRYISKTGLATACPLSVVKSSRSATALNLALGGLEPGKVTVTGKGLTKKSKTITAAAPQITSERRASTSVTVGATTHTSVALRLSKSVRRSLAAGRNVKVKVTVAFKAQGAAKTVKATKTITMHGTKKK